MDPVPSDNQTHSFLSTEFFFYLLPCYVAICSFAYRYYVISKQQPIRNVKELPGEIMVTCLEQAYDFEADDTVIPPASYTVKSKLSLMNCYTYVGMVLLGVLGDPDLYYSAQHRMYSALYLFGVVAWGMAALLLRRQFQRGIGQSLWTHRFFWIFAGTFSVTKMFEDYLLPINFVINVVFIINNGVLAMYAMYRPEDRDDNYFQMNDMPSFARIFFQKLELNEYVRKYLRIEDQPLKINVDDLTTNEEDIAKDLEAFKTSLTSNAKAVAEGIDLLNKLPRRNIIVNNRVRIKKINDTVKYYFFIITQIGDNRFEAERKFSEFVDLENSLSVHFSDKNFPKLKLPKLNKSEFNNVAEGESTRRTEILEEWLKDLLNNPIYMIDPVLRFLNIDEENSAPFLTYYNVSYTSLCSEVFLFNAFREKKQIQFRQQRISVWGKVEEESEDGPKTLSNLVSAKMEFEVVPDEQSLSNGEYKFALTCKTPKKQPIRWTVTKSEEQFTTLNERIEEETDSMVPIYYQSVLRIPQHMRSKTKITKEKLEAYCRYLQRLLDSKQYYTFALFDFVMFDPIKLQLVHDRSNLAALHAREPQSSSGKLTEVYQTTGAEIEVIKIRVSDGKDGQLKFKFIFRKRGVGLFSKLASDIMLLRTKIVRIYKGIASVPELCDFSRRPEQSELCNLKLSVENFLTALEGLPQIKTNQAVVQFYAPETNARLSESSQGSAAHHE